MAATFKYFNRDISWLAFNHRVLEEAADKSLPLFERLKFLAIYSSNLDEFYKVRVAEYKSGLDSDELGPGPLSSPGGVVRKINTIVNAQMQEFGRIFHHEILAELYRLGLVLYQGEWPEHEEHRQFIKDFFYREVVPYLQPVMLNKGTRSFLRDNRLYLAIRLYRKKKTQDPEKLALRRPRYAMVKLPTNDLPRFIGLPKVDKKHHFLFLDDLIRFNLHELFPGYDIDTSFSIKMLRDADLGIEDEFSGDLVEKIKSNIGLRKVGEPALFLYDRGMSADFLHFLKDTFALSKGDLLAGDRYLNFHDFFDFPNPFAPRHQLQTLKPLHPPALENALSMFGAIKKKDVILHYPYQSFDYVLKFLHEAATDPKVDEIKVTQYRVANNSAVVNALIGAARNKKKVTVFVEVKARFDEENNLQNARLMEEAGVRIIYSIPGLKVHAKMALVVRRSGKVQKRSYAYMSTGNFNEKTARLYADHGFFTCKDPFIHEMQTLFNYFEDNSITPEFNKLMVTRFNMKQELMKLIDREIEIAQKNGSGYLLLKMNGIQNKLLINKLYEASSKGVKIDLIIRGICCVVPQRAFSRNIRIIRIVDSFLEHARVWVFGKGERQVVYLSSADWLNRNINRRIEIAFPLEDETLKNEVLSILDLQLRDSEKARLINSKLENVPVPPTGEKIRAQWDTIALLKASHAG